MFNNLLIKKNKFTLIELIVVIGILAILASLVLPNIQGVEAEAKGVALATERKSIQTAVDMYNIDHVEPPVLADETTGEVVEIKIGEPGIISMYKLYPKYLRDFPSTAGARYWLDYTGKIWVSLADAPTGLTNTNGDLSWNVVEGAVEYIIYEYSNANSNSKYNLTEIGRVKETSYAGLKPDGNYLVQSVDNKNNKSASVKSGYTGYKNQKPILDFRLLNTGEITNETLLEFDWNNSFDPDGDELSIHKIIVDGNEVQSFPEYLTTGEHTVQLSLIDSKSYISDLNELSITVVDANKPPVAVLKLANTGDLVYDSTLLEFDWSESTDPNNDPLMINEIKLNGSVVSEFPEYLTEGEHTVAFNIRDDQGLISETVSLTINVWTSIKVDQDATELAAGFKHTLILDSNGTVWAWGENSSGQLGDGSFVNKDYPVQVANLNNIVAIDGHYGSSYALQDDGTVWAWGLNSSGQLGTGDTTSKNTPTIIEGLSNIVKIKAATSSLVALDEKGDVYTVGANSNSQLGVPSISGNATTSQKVAIENVVDIVAGAQHVLALKENGELWGWGRNDFGQLGTGDFSSKTIPTLINSNKNIKSIFVNKWHSSGFITDSGQVYVFGRNNGNQLGTGDLVNKNEPILLNFSETVDVKEVKGTSDDFIFLTNTGNVWVVGKNSNHELGLWDTSNISSPIKHSSLSNVSTIGTGYYHTIIKTNNNYVTFGNNTHGQLGLNNGGTSTFSVNELEYPDYVEMLPANNYIETISASSTGVGSDVLNLIDDDILLDSEYNDNYYRGWRTESMSMALNLPATNKPYITYTFTEPIKIKTLDIKAYYFRGYETFKDFKVYGANNSNFSDSQLIYSGENPDDTDYTYKTFNINSSEYYKYYRLEFLTKHYGNGNNNGVAVQEIIVK